MIRRFMLVLTMITALMLSACSIDGPAGSSPSGQPAPSSNDGMTESETLEEEELFGIQLLRTETETPEGLGNSITNLRDLGMIAGDDRQLYTLEYWVQASGEKKAGNQIYVSDASGKRCLTSEKSIRGYLNLTDKALYYVCDRGICKIDRESERVQEVISVGDIGYMLVVGEQIYYVISDALYSFDLNTGQQKEIAPLVSRGYLDYAQGQVYFCTGFEIPPGVEAIDIKKESSLCALKEDGSIETLYSFDMAERHVLKVMDADTVLCASLKEKGVPGPDKYDLLMLNLKENTEKVLISNLIPNIFALNGEQLIVEVWETSVSTHWLIDLKDGSARKLPDWGIGDLNFASDRLFLVNVATGKISELFRKNDQFFAEPLP